MLIVPGIKPLKLLKLTPKPDDINGIFPCGTLFIYTYLSTSCRVVLSVHFAPVFKKNLLPKGLPVADAFPPPETSNST